MTADRKRKVEIMARNATKDKAQLDVPPETMPDPITAECDAASDAERMARGTCKDAAAWLDEPDEPDAPLVHGLIERGEMFAAVGQSKAGKSFAALQLCVCVATGIPFLGHPVERSRTYVANLEVSAKTYKKRLRRMCAKLGVRPDELRGRLFVENLKGENVTWQWVFDSCRANGCALAVIDPFYQIFKDDESDVAACAAAIDEMKRFQKAQITLGIVFHSPKGFSGDRQLIDMISGSSILARFPESVIGLLNHAHNPTCRVVDAVLRNYAPPEPFTVELCDGAFILAPDVAPEVETVRTRMQRRTAREAPALADAIAETLRMAQADAERRGDAFKGLPVGVAADKARKLYVEKNGCALGEKRMPAEIKTMAVDGTVVITERRPERNGEKLVGLPEQMRWYTTPALPGMDAPNRSVRPMVPGGDLVAQGGAE